MLVLESPRDDRGRGRLSLTSGYCAQARRPVESHRLRGIRTTQYALRRFPWRRSHVRTATAPLLAAALLLCGTAFAELTLVRDGRPLAAIVISAQATAAEKLAATELARYVERVSGAKLAVVGAADATKGPRVLVGTLERLDEFKVSTAKLPLHIEGFVIRAIGDDLLLAGRSELGTVFAVYHFLERHLGCR
ncbi:MAG: hypothetical protein FJ272_10155, partial [Planctomycetes bacterium]|nr:hypothetical protein [Planctomycetota bacterium]